MKLNGLGDLIDDAIYAAVNSVDYTADFSGAFTIPTSDVTGVQNMLGDSNGGMDQSWWQTDVAANANTNLTVNNGGMDQSYWQTDAAINANNQSSTSTLVQSGPGSTYDTATGTHYLADGSVVDKDGNWIAKGMSFEVSSTDKLVSLAKAGWSALSQYRAVSLPGGGVMLVPKSQVGVNGQVMTGQYAGQATYDPNAAAGGLSALFSNPMMLLLLAGVAFIAFKGK